MLRYCHRFIIFSFSICGFLYGLKGQQEHIQIPKSTFSLNNYNPSNDYLPSIQWVIEENDIEELERSIQQDSISKEKLIYFNDKESFWAITNALYWFHLRFDSSFKLDYF